MILTIASQKGGTGKTSTAISLAAGIAHGGDKVLLVDLDPQSNSSKVLIPDYQKIRKEDTTYSTIIDRQGVPITPSSVANLDISPAHILLSEADMRLTTALDHREERLKAGLQQLQGAYKHILIDTPPNLGWLTINAFTASDKVLVTCSPGFFELDSINQLGKVIAEVRENYNAEIELAGILFTLADSTVSSRESLRILRQTYTSLVLNHIIPRNVDLRDASFKHMDVFTYKPDCKAASEYQKVIVEVGL